MHRTMRLVLQHNLIQGWCYQPERARERPAYDNGR